MFCVQKIASYITNWLTVCVCMDAGAHVSIIKTEHIARYNLLSSLISQLFLRNRHSIAIYNQLATEIILLSCLKLILISKIQSTWRFAKQQPCSQLCVYSYYYSTATCGLRRLLKSICSWANLCSQFSEPFQASKTVHLQKQYAFQLMLSRRRASLYGCMPIYNHIRTVLVTQCDCTLHLNTYTANYRWWACSHSCEAN